MSAESVVGEHVVGERVISKRVVGELIRARGATRSESLASASSVFMTPIVLFLTPSPHVRPSARDRQ